MGCQIKAPQPKNNSMVPEPSLSALTLKPVLCETLTMIEYTAAEDQAMASV